MITRPAKKRLYSDYLRERVQGLPPSTATDTALMLMDAYTHLESSYTAQKTQLEDSQTENARLKEVLSMFLVDDATVTWYTGYNDSPDYCWFCHTDTVYVDGGVTQHPHTADCPVTQARALLDPS